MITQHALAPNPGSRKKNRIVGRGDGSGHGSYSTRGNKGQSARSGGKVKPGFEGGQTPLLRRIPKWKGFKNINRIAFQVVNVSALEKFDAGDTIDLIALYEKGLISKKTLPVKVLGDGALTKKLTVKVEAVSASAKKKIESAGGSVTTTVKSPVK